MVSDLKYMMMNITQGSSAMHMSYGFDYEGYGGEHI